MHVWPRYRTMLLIVVAASLLCETAAAIPVFARKYNTPCGTCHVGGPFKRNPFGEMFRLNGYQMPGGSEMDLRRQAEIALGAPARSALFPESVWPGELPASFPFSARVLIGMTFDPESGEKIFQFESPTSVTLMMGGTLGRHFGFYGNVSLGEGGNQVRDIVLVVSDPLGSLLPDGMLSVRLGRFRPLLSFGNSVNSPRAAGGQFRLGDRQAGIEVYGRPTGRILWVAGLVNGEDIGQDVRGGKDVYGGVEYKLGGVPYHSTDGVTATAIQPWREKSLRFGVGGYYGKHTTIPDEPDPAFENGFWRALVKARGTFQDLDVMMAVIMGKDENADGSGMTIDTVGVRGRAEYVLFPWIRFRLQYDESHVGDAEPSRSLSPSIIAFPRMNIRTSLSTTLDLKDLQFPALRFATYVVF